jgi:hypothetical protein
MQQGTQGPERSKIVKGMSDRIRGQTKSFPFNFSKEILGVSILAF